MADITEQMLKHLIVELIRTNNLNPDLISAAADEADAEGQADAAHNLRCLILHAAAPRTSDWKAEQKRQQIRERTAWLAKQSTPDGGNKG